MPTLIVARGPIAPESPVVGPPQVTPGRPSGLQVTWFGADGSTWDLTNGPVRLAAGGVRGFGAALPLHYRSTSPKLPGAVWEDMSTATGEIFLPLTVSAADGMSLLEVDSAFRASVLTGTLLGTLRIARPDGQWRQIGCRYEEGLEGDYDLDPSRFDPVYGVRFTTEDPFWRGDPANILFPYSPPVPFFRTASPWVVNPGSSLDSATVTNLGGVPAYATWRASGPFAGFTVGVGDSVTSLTVTKVAGEWVDVDATPGELTMLDQDAVDMWDYATSEDLLGMAIPPGESVDVVTSLVSPGPGSGVSVTFTPGSRGPW